ncbi:MAG TPA: hypothetical protein VF746_06325 [Longimicrobium sp.]|jgi:hypothetical protein
MSDQNPGSPKANPDRAAVYQQLCSSYHQIDDFRAKLLALLPFASAAGLFLLLNDKLPHRSAVEAAGPFFVPIGIFGAVVTLGLFSYEIYGIRKCGALIDTGIRLERKMKVRGQFMSRPNCLVNEPLAAGVIYPAVLAGWLFLALVAWSATAALAVAGLVFLVGFAFMLAWDVGMVRKARERENQALAADRLRDAGLRESRGRSGDSPPATALR